MLSWSGRFGPSPTSTFGNALGISLLSASRSSDVLPSGHWRDGSPVERESWYGVRPIPARSMSSVSPSPTPSGKPGRPRIQQSAAETAWPPAPSRPPEPRQYSPKNASSLMPAWLTRYCL
jgi:hypothetical protein